MHQQTQKKLELDQGRVTKSSPEVEKFLEKLSRQPGVSSQNINMWFSLLHNHPEEMYNGGGIVSIPVPNEFARSWLRDHYTGQIQKAITETFGQGIKAVIEVNESLGEKSSETLKKVTKSIFPPKPSSTTNIPTTPVLEADISETWQDMTLKKFLTPKDLFKTFPKKVVEMLAQSYGMENPSKQMSQFLRVYIQGPHGSGKTHLATGLYQGLLSRGVRAIHLSGEQFKQQFMEVSRKNHELKTSAPKDKWRRSLKDLEAILIDGVGGIVKADKTELELRELIDDFHKYGKLMVFTGQQLPSEYSWKNPDLGDRLNEASQLILEYPDIETRQEYVESKLQEYFSDKKKLKEAAKYLATVFDKTFRDLKGPTDQIIATYEFMKSSGMDASLNLRFIEQVVARRKHGAPISPSLEGIRDRVCEEYHTSISKLISKSRKKEDIEPRQAFVYLARNYSPESTWKEIGGLIARDHSTAMSDYKAATRKIDSDPDFGPPIYTIRSSFEKKE